MKDTDNAPTDFADTLELPLHELPSAAERSVPPVPDPVVRVAAPLPAAPIARRAARVVNLVAPVAGPVAPVAGPAASITPAAPITLPAPVTPVVPVAPAAPVVAASTTSFKRRAGDTDTGTPPRFSLHRRRSTDRKPAFDVPSAPTGAAPPPPVVRDKPAAPQPALCLFVRGFNDNEKKLLDGTVRLSQRRVPRLALVPEAQAATADVVMIDGLDAEAVAWAEARPWLARKKMIWVDSQLSRPGHTEVRRPVQWPLLPMLLARALEQRRAPDVQPGSVAPTALTAPPALTAPSVATAPTALGRTAAPATPPVTPASADRVLVIDDSLAVRNYLRSLLEARGIEVSEADCVGDALAALGAVPAGHFVCALMDVLMPDMDGYEGCRRIKAAKASLGALPVVMLTSKNSPFDRIRGKMAGCDAYLTKPVAPALLYAALSPYRAPRSTGPVTPPAPPALPAPSLATSAARSPAPAPATLAPPDRLAPTRRR